MTLSTGEVARLLGVPRCRVQSAVNDRRCKEPARDRFGRFIWTEGDVEDLKRGLATDRRRKQTA